MFFILSILFFIIILTLSAIIWQLYKYIKILAVDQEYMKYSIDFLSCNNYFLLGTYNGRELSTEEDCQLAIIQQQISEDSERLGLLNPFPRPPEKY